MLPTYLCVDFSPRARGARSDLEIFQSWRNNHQKRTKKSRSDRNLQVFREGVDVHKSLWATIFDERNQGVKKVYVVCIL